ncbi:MAG TPA: hypothetical protein VN681_13440 [Stellaceae bacterium]|nr:hypothetical protein [Stellaceae bacterium]
MSEDAGGVNRQLVRWTAVLAGATVVLVFGTLLLSIVSWRQLAEMRSEARRAEQRSYRQLIATQRPWVAVSEISPVGRIAFDGSAVVVTLNVVLKNTGASPAINGIVAAAMLGSVPGDPHEFVKSAAAKSCRSPSGNPKWEPFDVLSGSGPATQISAVGRRDDLGGSPVFSPYILVCAHYDMALDETQHGITVLLYELESADVERSTIALPAQGGSIDAKAMTLSPAALSDSQSETGALPSTSHASSALIRCRNTR